MNIIRRQAGWKSGLSFFVPINMYIYNLLKMYIIHIDAMYKLWEHGGAVKNTVLK
jgi:hypothetical protein